MENQKGHIYQLAIHYFEGSITLPEEEILFQFVNTTPDNYALFREWEKEWMLSATPKPAVVNEWNRLQRRMEVQRALSGMFGVKKYSLRQIAAVAAILIVVFLGGSYSVISYFDSKAEVNYFSLVTAYGEKSKIVLTDGTAVWLNSGSVLRYGDHFNAHNREVILEGEAYFEVEKKEDGTPFMVRTADYNVLVKGTKFNVTSYAEDAQSTITLLEGAIEVLYKDKHIAVIPGESVCFDKQKGYFTRHNVLASQYRSWVDGWVEYDEITLKELAIRLSRKYDVEIHLDAALDKEATFRVSLRNEETVGQFLQALSKIIPICFERQDRDIYIRKQ